MRPKTLPALLLLYSLLFPGVLLAANGYFLHGIGAVNESMGGAATAGNPQDLLGSLYRNPANANLFYGYLFSMSLGVIISDATVESSFSTLGITGSSDSDADTIPAGHLGMVFNGDNSPFSYYVAVVGEAGSYLDIPQSETNPIFIAQQGKWESRKVSTTAGLSGPATTTAAIPSVMTSHSTMWAHRSTTSTIWPWALHGWFHEKRLSMLAIPMLLKVRNPVHGMMRPVSPLGRRTFTPHWPMIKFQLVSPIHFSMGTSIKIFKHGGDMRVIVCFLLLTVFSAEAIFAGPAEELGEELKKCGTLNPNTVPDNWVSVGVMTGQHKSCFTYIPPTFRHIPLGEASNLYLEDDYTSASIIGGVLPPGYSCDLNGVINWYGDIVSQTGCINPKLEWYDVNLSSFVYSCTKNNVPLVGGVKVIVDGSNGLMCSVNVMGYAMPQTDIKKTCQLSQILNGVKCANPQYGGKVCHKPICSNNCKASGHRGGYCNSFEDCICVE